MTTRAAIYIRVSSDDQAEHGYSLQSQLEACQEYAGRLGLTVVEHVSEDFSGAKLARPGLDRLRQMIDRREADAVIVYSPDRLTRNLAHSLILREEWHTAGIGLHYCNRGKSENTPESRMTENIEAVFADYWRAKIVEGSRRGRVTKAANGKWPCDGHAAYGYAKEGRGREAQLVVNEPEAAVVRRIFALYTGARSGRPLTLQAIAAALTAEGVPPPNRGHGARRPGKGWYRASIRQILARRSYLGELSYAGHAINRPDLAIIDRQTFKAAERRRAGNSAVGTYKRKYEYLVTGRLLCTCGLNMSGFPLQGGKYLYYACNSAGNKRHLRHCQERRVRADQADALVWAWLDGLLQDERKLEQGLQRLSERQATESQAGRVRLELLDRLIAQAEEKIKELAAEFAHQTSALVRQSLRGEMKAAGREHEALTAEREALAAEQQQGELTGADRAAIHALAAAIRLRLADPTYEKKRALVNLLDLRLQLGHEDGERWLDATCGLTLRQTQDGSLTQDSTRLSLSGLCGVYSSTTTT